MGAGLFVEHTVPASARKTKSLEPVPQDTPHSPKLSLPPSPFQHRKSNGHKNWKQWSGRRKGGDGFHFGDFARHIARALLPVYHNL